jgi:hypothetical protein
MKPTSQIKIIAAIAIVLFATFAAFADIRIKFPRGRTSATMTGRIGNGGRVCYIARANAGQTLTATVSSRTGKVNILESGETSYSYDIEVSGDQSVCVDNLSRATSYTMTVSIR